MLVALAPRHDRITLYVAPGFDEHDELMSAIGTYRAGKGCIHIKRLGDIDVPTLKRLVTASIAHLRALPVARLRCDNGRRVEDRV